MKRAAIPLLVLAACSTTQREALVPPIVGTWDGTGGMAEGWVLECRPDGTAFWSIGERGWDLEYLFDASRRPYVFDLWGFGPDSGELEGKVLYGIVEFIDDGSMRWDAQPGVPGAGGEAARPSAFDPAETRVLVRR